MRHEMLTGKTRFRSERRWGVERLILQVQTKGLNTTYNGGQVDTDWRTAWRDATTKDISEGLPQTLTASQEDKV